jgi:hypothetical protein
MAESIISLLELEKQHYVLQYRRDAQRFFEYITRGQNVDSLLDLTKFQPDLINQSKKSRFSENALHPGPPFD